MTPTAGLDNRAPGRAVLGGPFTSLRAPASVEATVRSPGRPLDQRVRTSFDTRLGYDFRSVLIHADQGAARSARDVDADAYTVGRHIAFGSDRYAPWTMDGHRLLAHELMHVVQQGPRDASPGELRVGQPYDRPEREAERATAAATPGMRPHDDGLTVRRQLGGYGPEQADPLDDPRMHPAGAPKATTCAPPADCPATFCQPYSNESFAIHMRTKMLLGLMAGIAIAVDSRVVPLWHEHLLGGSGVKDLSKAFAADFTASRSTRRTTDYLEGELRRSFVSSPPTVGSSMLGLPIEFVDLTSRIAGPIAEIDKPGGPHEMNFNIPKEVPGNIAGAIGKDQLACKAGAKPSPQNDERLATVSGVLTRDASGAITAGVSINYTVKDTIDLCPGDCGTSLEQFATIPISQFEATGISGDVPFIVNFTDGRTINLPAPATGVKPPAPAAPAAPKVPVGSGKP
jgi:hypothetical protein